MNIIALKTNWSIVKGKLKEKYRNLTDNDLAYISGREDDMLGHIQLKTGASRDELEGYLREECNCCG
jgi:uncharacterized protein YjbJ (UPF0337 family)